MNNVFSADQQKLLGQSLIAVVSVLSPKGLPYLTPIWFVEHNNKLYFSTLKTRTKGKFLSQNTNIGINITHPDGFPYVSVAGKAEIRTKSEFNEYEEIVEKLFDRYVTENKEKSIQDNLNNKDRILVEINPIRVLG